MKRLALLVLLLPRLVWATCNTDSYSTAVCNMSPIRYFRMDAPSGTSETDLGSSATNGTYHNGFTLGATGIPALTDKAASFSG
jgi:hypothetical protein